MKRLYYSIKDITEIVNEEKHILRYWEKEFEHLNPRKNRGGNRIYSSRDLKIIKAIKKLLREENLSLKGAKDRLNELMDKADGLDGYLPDDTGVVTETKASYHNDQLFSDEKEEIQTTLKSDSGKVVLKESDAREILNLLLEIRKILKES